MRACVTGRLARLHHSTAITSEPQRGTRVPRHRCNALCDAMRTAAAHLSVPCEDVQATVPARAKTQALGQGRQDLRGRSACDLQQRERAVQHDKPVPRTPVQRFSMAQRPRRQSRSSWWLGWARCGMASRAGAAGSEHPHRLVRIWGLARGGGITLRGRPPEPGTPSRRTATAAPPVAACATAATQDTALDQPAVRHTHTPDLSAARKLASRAAPRTAAPSATPSAPSWLPYSSAPPAHATDCTQPAPSCATCGTWRAGPRPHAHDATVNLAASSLGARMTSMRRSVVCSDTRLGVRGWRARDTQP
jgi:hypothetical protein